jgi:hypothetical protein
MTTTLLNDLQRTRLRDLAKVRHDKNYPIMPNVALEKYIQELKDQYPEAFHSTRQTMVERVFVDEPTTITPHFRFVRSRNASPYRIVPETA